MAPWSHEWRSLLTLYRSMPRIFRAQRAFGRARRLQREHRYHEAFRVAVLAFGDLSQLADGAEPGAGAILATEGVLVDELARQVGQPGAAREELQHALRICEEASGMSPRLEPSLREYIEWYKHRLAAEQQPSGAPH